MGVIYNNLFGFVLNYVVIFSICINGMGDVYMINGILGIWGNDVLI